jgi:hypothetical protein
MLDQILFDYIRQNQDEPMYRKAKARIKAALNVFGGTALSFLFHHRVDLRP